MSVELLIGSRDAEHLVIEVLGREGPGDADYWDGDWVLADIELAVGGFRGTVESTLLRIDEFHRLNEGLKFMRDNLFGSAVLESMEDGSRSTSSARPLADSRFRASYATSPAQAMC